MINIYTLTDPRTGDVRYVGKTKQNLSDRLQSHLADTRKGIRSHKVSWLRQLRSVGLIPVIEILDEVPDDEWKFWERFWIQQIRAWGFNLTNTLGGGEGLSFGNQTSFKPGFTPWNKGTARIKILKNNRGKAGRSLDTQFKSGMMPWNKNNPGYTTKKRGYITPDSVRQKISKTLVGNNNKPTRPVKQLTTDGNLVAEFISVRAAQQDTGIRGISNVLTGRSKTAGGYIWV